MPFQDPNNKRRTTDLLKSNNEYRIDVEANPTVPILGIYTEARTKALAVALANAAVQGLNDYVTNVAQNQGVKAAAQVRLLQLGAAEGGTVTPGAATQLMAIVFLLTFAFACTISVVLARLVRGWRTARDAHRRDGGDQRSPLAHRNGEARPTLAT
jgi:hypothetical protein